VPGLPWEREIDSSKEPLPGKSLVEVSWVNVLFTKELWLALRPRVL